MDENKIKEQLSKCFIKAIGYNGCCNFSEDENDYGVDLSIKQMSTRQEGGGTRYYTNGKAIDIQLKSTTEAGITETDDLVRYPLNVKNYNDIIQRNIDSSPNPLILVLFVLPENRGEWVLLGDTLVLSKCAYRHKIDEVELSTNATTVTINIPKENKITLETMNNLFGDIC